MPLYNPSGGASAALVVPKIADFTALNIGTSTVSDGNGALIVTPDQNAKIIGYTQVAPAATFVADLKMAQTWKTTNGGTSQSNYIGLAVKNGARIVMMGVGVNNSNNIRPFFRRLDSSDTGATVASGGGLQPIPYFTEWVRLEVTATDIIGYTSHDGLDWHENTRATLTSFLTAAGGSATDVMLAARVDSAQCLPTMYYRHFEIA